MSIENNTFDCRMLKYLDHLHFRIIFLIIMFNNKKTLAFLIFTVFRLKFTKWICSCSFCSQSLFNIPTSSTWLFKNYLFMQTLSVATGGGLKIGWLKQDNTSFLLYISVISICTPIQKINQSSPFYYQGWEFACTFWQLVR